MHFILAAAIVATAVAPEAVSLSEALAMVRASSPDIKAADAAVEAARARETQAAALPNPNVALIVDQVPVPSPMAGNYMAGVSQPLLPAGQLAARIDLARAETRLAEVEREAVTLGAVTRLKEAYADLLFEAAGEDLAQLTLRGAQAAHAGDLTRLRAGEIAPLDLARREVATGRARRFAVSARNRHLGARARLNVLMGRASDAPLTLTTRHLTRPSLPSPTHLKAAASSHRMELRRAALQVERELLQRRLALASIWTGTEVTGAFGAVGGQPGVSATLTLPVPFYRQQGEVAEAEADRRRAEAERARLHNLILVEVDEAYRAAADAEAEVMAFTASYVPEAERLVAAAAKRRQMGEGSALESTDARRVLLETRLEQARAELAYRRALVRLERAVGYDVLGPDTGEGTPP